MRGSRALKASSDPLIVSRINEGLTLLNLGFTSRDCPALVFDSPVADFELATRQYLLSRCGGLPLNAAILLSLGVRNGSTVAAIPGQWISRLRREGIAVARFRSNALFARFVAGHLVRGMIQIAGILIRRRDPGEPHGCVAYAHFIDLTEGNLPRLSGRKSYDIVSWYLRWTGRIAPLEEVRHGVAERPPRSVDGVILRPVARTIPALNGVNRRARFLWWSIGAIAGALWGAVTGRWAIPLMLGEAARAQQLALTVDEELAQEYLFSLSAAIYRPLWTYGAAQRGSLITLYNYAASFQDFKTRELGTPPLEIGFQAMSWPRILLWSESHANFSRSVVRRESTVELVSPIWFTDSDDELPVATRPCVAVFDVTPVRRSREAIAVNALEYRTFSIGQRFLEDIYAVVHSLGYDLLWKRKRGHAAIHDRRYAAFANDFAARPGVLDVSPGISAFRVVEKSCAVISMPFTSTAFIARGFSRPSVFFDPTGLLFQDDRATQGIALLSTRVELSRWLTQAIHTAR